MTADAAALGLLLRHVDPAIRLLRVSDLAGGTSAKVSAVEVERPGGARETLVVRQYGDANLRTDPHSASHEFQLLSLLHGAGLPVPRPVHADESAAILPRPCLVTAFVDGTTVTSRGQLTEPVAGFTGQLAAFLARLHDAAFTRADAAYLQDLPQIAAARVRMRPAVPDEALSEPAVRAALTASWPPPQASELVLLHGDYWPGNILWRDGTLVCVLDWEDAVLGDPLTDLGTARMEIWMAFGAAAAAQFTSQYCELRPDVDLAALPHWYLYAALRHAGRMSEWGLSAAELASLQAGHHEFAAAALAAAPAWPSPGQGRHNVEADRDGPGGREEDVISAGSQPRASADASPPPLPAWRVLDMSQAISGPYAGRILSDLGADVLRVDGPRTDVTELFGAVVDGRAGMYAQMNAGKRSIAVDLTAEGGTELIRDLAAQADVLIENFRPGVMDRRGLGYERLAAANTRLVMLSVSGFGPAGPAAGRRALAPVIHAESGLLARQADLDDREPADLPLALADTVTGLHAAIALLAALHQRAVTGRGQHIDLSMLAAVAASDDHAHAAIDGSEEPYSSRGTIWHAPGGPILIAAPPKHAWVMLSRRGLIADPAPPGSDLTVKAHLRQQAIQDWMTGFSSRQDLIAELEGAGIAWADLADSSDVFAGGAHTAGPPGGGRRVVAMPYEFSAASAQVRRAVARTGEHNSEALADWLGLDQAAVSALTDRGVLFSR